MGRLRHFRAGIFRGLATAKLAEVMLAITISKAFGLQVRAGTPHAPTRPAHSCLTVLWPHDG
jgi:hypothetical protein